MSAACYSEAIGRLLKSEGGYVNHPSDPGGPTNFGITLADYRKYKKPDATAADVRRMKMSEAKDIYQSKYWNAIRGDDLPAGVDYCLFDYAVNSGTGRAPKVLQRILGVAVTGRIDDATIAAAKAAEAKHTIVAICDERLRFLKGLKTWSVFGAGWSRRVSEVRAAALVMAASPAVSVGKAFAADVPAAAASGTHAQIGQTLPGQSPVPVTPIAGTSPLPAPAAPAAAPASPPAQEPKHDGWFAGIAATLMAVLAAAYNWLQEYLPEILLGLAVLIVIALIAYRLVKGRFPWTSLHFPGVQSPAQLRLSPPRSAAFSATPSRHLEELSAALQDLHSLAPSARPRRRKRSAAPSPRTRRPPRKSKSSKPSTRTRSSSKRKSRSKR